MEYLVPVLIIVVIGAVVAGGAWWLSRRQASAASGSTAGGIRGDRRGGRRGARRPLTARVSSESARAASSRLDQSTHREVYRLIAAGRTGDAVVAYRKSTGRGTFEAMLDIQALATYPQMWVAPAPRAGRPEDGSPGSAAGTEPAAGTGPTPAGQAPGQAVSQSGRPGGREPGEEPGTPAPSPRPAEADTPNLVIPQDWLTERLPADRPFELEVVRDETTVRVSSADLAPFLRDQLTAMVRDGRVEEAALELSAHTVLTADEALQFLRILQREQGQDD